MGSRGVDGSCSSDVDGRATSPWLACEAKCTRNHSSTLIKDNLAKLSQAVTRPVDLLRLIEALKDYSDDDYSRKWMASLRRYWWELSKKSSADRCDFSMYVCGICPRKKSAWIPTSGPHKSYTGRRTLTCAEFHLIGVDDIIPKRIHLPGNT